MIDKSYRYMDSRYARAVETYKLIEGGFEIYLSDGQKGLINMRCSRQHHQNSCCARKNDAAEV